MIGLDGDGGDIYHPILLSRWFILKLGKVTAIVVIGTTAGIFVFSPLSAFLIAIKIWCSAWLIQGCIGSLVVALVAPLVIRKYPQPMRLQPYGLPTVDFATEKKNIEVENNQTGYSWSREQAIRTYTFWALVIIHGFRILSIRTLHVFRIPFYIEQGIASHLVAWAIPFEALVSVFISLFVGFAVDSIRGIFLVASLILSTIGSLIFGAVKDATGVYIPAWISALVLLAVATLIMLMTTKPLSFFEEEDVYSLQRPPENGRLAFLTF